MLGATITELSGGDTMSDFPTVYNANLNSLNNGKIEIGTTTLPLIITLSGLTSASSLSVIGTIGTGVWEGTAITVTFGGTGTTTPTLNQIILGNASNGFKVVSGFGTSGQFLTSAGLGSVPTWTTGIVNQALAYDWTGEHSWTATTTMATTTIDKILAETGNVSIITNLQVDSITNSGATTTLIGDLNITGNIDWSGSQYTGVKWEYISSASISGASTTIATGAKFAIVFLKMIDTDPTPDTFFRTQFTLAEIGVTELIKYHIIGAGSSNEDTISNENIAASRLAVVDLKWNNGFIEVYQTGMETIAGIVYYYK